MDTRTTSAPAGAGALPLLEQAAEHGRAIGFMHGHSLVGALLAEGYLRAGRLDDASRTAGEALALARKLGERGWEAWTLRVLGELAAEHSPAEATVRHAEALALATELGMRPLQVSPGWPALARNGPSPPTSTGRWR